MESGLSAATVPKGSRTSLWEIPGDLFIGSESGDRALLVENATIYYQKFPFARAHMGLMQKVSVNSA
jgi:hypothetical protein